MKNFKKILGLLLAMTLLLGSVFALSACGGGDEGGGSKKPAPCEHADIDDNGKCDKCAADYEDGKDLPDVPASTPAFVTYTITVKSSDGKAVNGAKVKIVTAAGDSYVLKETEKGKAIFEPGLGDWKAQLVEVPAGYAAPESYAAIDFNDAGEANFVIEKAAK